MRVARAEDELTIYIAETFYQRIREINPARIITALAGGGDHGLGDGGPAAGATLNYPGGLAVDPTGDLCIADSRNNRIRQIDRAGIISTIAGTG